MHGRSFTTAIALVAILVAIADAGEVADDLAGLTVRSIEIVGARATQEEVVLDQLATKVDEAFDPEQLERDRRALLVLGAFSEVTVDARRVADGVAITLWVTEASTYRLSPAFLINAEGGLSLGGTLSTSNAEGTLVRGKVGVLFGGLQQTHIEVDAPRVQGYYGRHHLTYFNRQRDNTVLDFFEVANEVFAIFAPRLGDNSRVGLLAGYQRLRADRDQRTLSADRVDDVNTFGLLVGIDTAGPPVVGRRGWAVEAGVERTGLLGGQSEFWRGQLDLRRYQAVADRHILALTALVTVTSGAVGEVIAPWQTYHLGGTNTVRGWEVGSRSGKHQAIGTAEWRWTLRQPDPLTLALGARPRLGLQLVAFGDTGLAWSGEADARLDHFISGYGLGLHLVGPGIGRLRLDLAHGQGSPTLVLAIGSGSKAEAQRRRVR